MSRPPAARASLDAAIQSFVEAFNANDLDRVMDHFAEDAVYRPGNGAERVGRVAIRRELEPQFRGAYGAMRFDEQDRLVDEGARKAAIRWVCRHDLAHARHAGLALWLQRVVVAALVGDRFGWEGVDVFHFDAEGRIRGKFTYASYTRPRLRRELGTRLPPLAAPPPRAPRART